jgi:hypothetical protein
VALQVLLRLTPRPADTETFLPASSRDGLCTAANHSLTQPLLQHPDTATAITAALHSRPATASKAAQLMAILIQSEDAVRSAEPNWSSSSSHRGDAFEKFCRSLCSSSSDDPTRSSAAMADPNTVLGAYIAELELGKVHAAATGKVAAAGGSSSSSSSSSSSAWRGVTHLLRSQNHAAAGAAAEALAAAGCCKDLTDICTSLTATQQARPLLLLLSHHQVHPGAAGAAAAALTSLANRLLRPAMYRILANSYFDPATSENGPTLGELLVQVMTNGNHLAIRRAAALAAALAAAVDWQGNSSLWIETFKAGQQLLLSGTSAGGNGSSSKNRAAGALLLRQLIGRCTDMSAAAAAALCEAAGSDAGSLPLSPLVSAGVDEEVRNDMLFEVLQLSVQQFGLSGNWEGLHAGEGHQQHLHHHLHSKQQQHTKGRSSSSSGGGGGSSKAAVAAPPPPQYDEGFVAAELLSVLLEWLPAEACCCVPELFSMVVPVLEHLLATKQGSRQLQHAARHLQQQLLTLG